MEEKKIICIAFKALENLPKKMMYQTFCVIFDYLLDSGKIALYREGKVAWIWFYYYTN